MRYRLRLSSAILLAGFGLFLADAEVGSRLPGILPNALAAESVKGESSSEIDGQRAIITRPRLREGSRIGSTIGRFSRAGRRWIFEVEPTSAKNEDAEALPSTSALSEQPAPQEPMMATKYQVLENLALQRIVDSVSQDPNDLRWTVTGAFTEFSGENWLLLSTVFRAPSKTDSAASK